MKKLFALILALCLIVGLLPMAALAEAPESVKVTFYVASKTRIYKTLSNGDVAYVTSVDKLITDWNEEEAPTDNFMKMEYADGVMKVTFNNFDADMTEAGGYTCHGIEFPSGEYIINVELVGENFLQHGKSASIKYNNAGGMTITGAGSLNITHTADPSGAIWANGGDLLIKNTTVNFNVNPGNNSKHHAIFASTGSVTLEGVKINTVIQGGALVYLGTTTAKVGRYTLDTENTDRKITVKDCEIISKSSGAILSSHNPATISNTAMKVTLTNSSGPAFEPAPTIEGEYSAIAGLAKNAEKLDKLKEFNMKKLGSYTYIYMVPGKVDLLPTEATEPETQAPTTEETVAPTTEATVPDETKNEATKPTTSDKNEATQPTTGDKNEATQPADKDDNKTDDKGEEKSGSPLKVILIILIALIVLGGGAVAVVLILRNKNASEEEDEEEEEEEEEAEEE